jgi:hypothetical protein
MMPLGVNDRWNNKFDMEIRNDIVTKKEGTSDLKQFPSSSFVVELCNCLFYFMVFL